MLDVICRWNIIKYSETESLRRFYAGEMVNSVGYAAPRRAASQTYPSKRRKKGNSRARYTFNFVNSFAYRLRSAICVEKQMV